MSRIKLAASLAIVPLLAGCFATKQDMEDLRLEMQSSRTAQEQQIRRLIDRTEAMLDSLATQNNRLRGDLANRLVQIERQLVQIQELSGQSQAQLTELRRQINQRAEEARRAAEAAQAAADTTGEGGGEDASPEDAQALYDAALGAYRRGSMSTARQGFEEFLRAAPGHRQAADAQFYVGETYAREPERAIAAFDRVLERYPDSQRAPTALLRIGKIELERGNRTQARARFNQLVRAYPRSESATEARRELQRLGTGTTRS
jgi:tol-pal system protein YbgF